MSVVVLAGMHARMRKACMRASERACVRVHADGACVELQYWRDSPDIASRMSMQGCFRQVAKFGVPRWRTAPISEVAKRSECPKKAIGLHFATSG